MTLTPVVLTRVQFTDTVYRIPTSDGAYPIFAFESFMLKHHLPGQENLVFPPKLMPEFRKLTDDVAGFYPAAAQV